MAIARIYLDCNFRQGETIALPATQAHYLANVLRMKTGDPLIVFHEAVGEFDAHLFEIKKKSVLVEIGALRRSPEPLPDLELCFAPLKKNRTDLVVEKATELGVAALTPMLTQYTNAERVRTDRLGKIAIEAAEQCEALMVPRINEPMKLAKYLDDVDDARHLIFCDERSAAGNGIDALSTLVDKPSTIFIGPEGGFSPQERELLLSRNAIQLSLGPRILRAETAAIAAISLWQMHAGDWR